MTLMNFVGCVWLLVFWAAMIFVGAVALTLLLHWLGLRW